MTEKEKDGVRWRVNNEELSEFLARRTFRGSPSLSPALLLHAGARRNRIPIIVPLSAVTFSPATGLCPHKRTRKFPPKRTN